MAGKFWDTTRVPFFQVVFRIYETCEKSRGPQIGRGAYAVPSSSIYKPNYVLNLFVLLLSSY